MLVREKAQKLLVHEGRTAEVNSYMEIRMIVEANLDLQQLAS